MPEGAAERIRGRAEGEEAKEREMEALDHGALPVAAISIAGPADRVLPVVEKSGPLVTRTASALSRRLGYVEPSNELRFP